MQTPAPNGGREPYDTNQINTSRRDTTDAETETHSDPQNAFDIPPQDWWGYDSNPIDNFDFSLPSFLGNWEVDINNIINYHNYHDTTN